MQHITLRMLSIVALLGMASYAQAADKGVYIGAGIGQSDVNVDRDSEVPEFSGTDSAYKIIAGVRLLDNLAIEANYIDMGEPDSGRNYVDSTGVSAFAVGLVKAGPVDLFAKGGAINWRAKITSDASAYKKRDGTDLAYGVGAQVRLLDLAIRAEYERFNIDGGANLLTLGVTWTFL